MLVVGVLLGDQEELHFAAEGRDLDCLARICRSPSSPQARPGSWFGHVVTHRSFSLAMSCPVISLVALAAMIDGFQSTFAPRRMSMMSTVGRVHGDPAERGGAFSAASFKPRPNARIRGKPSPMTDGQDHDAPLGRGGRTQP